MPSPYRTESLSDTEYVQVDLGPIPGLPSWHEQSKHSSFTFPNREVAERFATIQRQSYPNREISVR